ncbi:cardiolipin synthase (CMP-forming) [Candidatus Magnetomoraceae bacterium gMMP-15]
MKSSNSSITLANILTVLRILLTPLFVIFVIRGFFIHALLVFTVAAISDALDGLVARYFNQKSDLGAYLDPIADKMLLSSAFISLAILEILPGWLTVIVISRDILILMGIAIFSINNIKFKIEPSMASKLTTVAQLITVFLALLNINISQIYYIKIAFYWITAGLTILSGLHYLYIGMNILQKNFSKNIN